MVGKRLDVGAVVRSSGERSAISDLPKARWSVSEQQDDTASKGRLYDTESWIDLKHTKQRSMRNGRRPSQNGC